MKKGNLKKGNKNFKKSTVILISMLILMFIGGEFITQLIDDKVTEISYNEFNQMVDNKEVKEVLINFKSDTFTIVDNNDKEYITDNPKYSEFKKDLLTKDVKIEELSEPIWIDLFASLFPVFAMGGVLLLVFSKQTQVVTTSNKKIANIPNVKFSDVAGLKEVKDDMIDMVDFVRNPKKYKENGAKLPKGAILYGPSGTGKTLLAKAIAGEAGIPFFSASGSSFIEMFAGVGAKRVRELFNEARKNAPCIIFIDEIDAVGGKRANFSSNGEQRQTLNELLTQMDGFQGSEGVLVLCATNRLEDLDEALIRPGRFDKQLMVPLPNTPEDREEIIKLYTANKKLNEDVNIQYLSKITMGFSPAEIEALLNEATIIATKENDGIINTVNIDDAYYKILMKGNAQKSRKREEDTIKLVAYHESGHAFLANKYNMEVTKVTITPSTSGAGGVTMINPKEGLMSIQDMEERVKMSYGGRICEFLYRGNVQAKVTTGASSDIQNATNIIKAMISDYGMNEEVGMLSLRALEIDSDELLLKEAQKLSKKLYDEAKKDIMDNKHIIEAIANALILKETIDGEELSKIINEYSSKNENSDSLKEVSATVIE